MNLHEFMYNIYIYIITMYQMIFLQLYICIDCYKVSKRLTWDMNILSRYRVK